jgi:uncharacterized protein (TIGR02147 family)
METIRDETSLWHARSARAWTTAVAEARRAVDTSFSWRRLARWAGFGSPNYIQAWLRGERNLRPESAAALAAALDLRGPEVTFFCILVAFEQADDPDARHARYVDLLRLAVEHGETGRLDAARLAYFSSWFIPAIHAMASLQGFRREPHWIAARLVPRIRSFDAKQALDVLAELGIFGEDADGRFEIREPRLETEPGLQGVWLREYHRAMLRLAEQALDLWPVGRRIGSALTVTVPNTLVSALFERVDGFRRELFHWLMTEQSELDSVDGEVMQINLQAFPLSDCAGELES